MAAFGSSIAGWTPTAIATNVQATANNYHAIRCGAATAVVRLTEIYIGGEATSSTVNRMRYQRLSTNATAPTNIVPSPHNLASVAAVTGAYQTVGTTQPTFSNTGSVLTLAFNSFGGIVRWVAYPGEEIYQNTATAPNAEAALASLSGAGVVSTNIVFEEM